MSELKDQLDHLPGGLLITDRESKAVYANMAVEKRTGFAVGEIIGKKPGELWGGRMEKSFYQKMWRTISQEGRPFVGSVENVKKSGFGQLERIFIAPIKDERGDVTYFAEIHPEFHNKSQEELFSREFLFFAGRLGQEPAPLSWVVQSLQGKRKASAGKIISDGRVSDLASLFYDQLIQPMKKVFSRRYEDAELIQEAKLDTKKFSVLYEKYFPFIREYFMQRLSRDSETAEDLAQETFSRAFKHLPDFRITNASYYTYLLRIAHNLLVNYYRKHSYLTLSPEEADLERAPDTFQTADSSITHLLRGLSETEETIMRLKYHDGLKIKEIAEKIGKSENAVKLILSRTRKKLKEQFPA